MAEEYESAAEKLDQMMNGEYDFSSEDETVENTEPTDDGSVNDEETNQTDEESEVAVVEDETEETNDEEALEDINDEGDEEEEETEDNALVDDDEGKTAEEDSVDTETKDSEGVDPEKSEEEVNYQKKYEELLGKQDELQKFYDIATGEFKADGKMVKGFTDPHKIVQSQQAYYGLEGKMKVFKDHKPFIRALTERGITAEDTSKFNLAMDLVDGNADALREHLRSLDIDPMDLDMDDKSYEQKSHVASPIEIALDDVIDTASRYGVQDKMENVLGKEWDNDSVMKLLDRPQDSAILVEHMQNGIYDAVQERISENNRLDVNGSFRNRSNYDQYMIANKQLEDEYKQYIESQKTGNVEVEKAKIEDENAQNQYKQKVAIKEKEASEARARATRSSKPKSRPRKKRETNPMSLSGDKFQDYFNKEILGF